MIDHCALLKMSGRSDLPIDADGSVAVFDIRLGLMTVYIDSPGHSGIALIIITRRRHTSPEDDAVVIGVSGSNAVCEV